MKKTSGKIIIVAALLSIVIGYTMRYDIVGGFPDNNMSVQQ